MSCLTLRAAFLCFSMLAHYATSTAIPAQPTTTIKPLTWPAEGKTFTVANRPDMSLHFKDLPPDEDEGSGVASIDIYNSATIYIKQLTLKGENPFRGVNFPLGDEASGEQDCRVVGTIYRVRPVKTRDGHWNFSLQDTIDALKGVKSVAKGSEGLEESDVEVMMKGAKVADMKILNQFRGGEPSDEKCLDYNPGTNVQEVATA